MLLREMQGLLTGLYDVPAERDVYDYLITDGAHAAILQGQTGKPVTDEQLLLAESDDCVEVSLYLDAAVLERLVACCPLQSLCEENIADFCTALEGVSHFHYFIWSAERERSVSLLELELQAEVDKYAAALQLMLRQRDGSFPAELFPRLFENVGFLPHLADEERLRYVEAHRHAARFCRRLEERFLRTRKTHPEGLLAELRTFYRLGRHAKLRHCAG